MAGIERGDAIRRPVDSTLSARSLHRGQEGILQAQPEVLDKLRQTAPAIAVVVERKNLGSQAKPLFDLLLSVDNQWVRARSDRAFQPGTVLLIEVTPNQELRALPAPDPGQLNRMIQASLSFWQAHTLPRVNATQLPSLPDAAAQQQLAREHPGLRPLLDWLNQPTTLDRVAVARWVREFMPLGAGNGPRQATAPSTPSQLPAGMPPDGPVAPDTTLSRPGAGPRTPPHWPLQPLPASIQATVTTQAPGRTVPPAVLQAAVEAGYTAPTRADNPEPFRSSFVPARSIPLIDTGAPALPRAATVAGAPIPPPLSALGALMPSAPPLPQPARGAENPFVAGTPASDWRPLVSPSGESGRIPIEIRLGEWLGLIEQRIRQHPASLQQNLTLQARQMLGSAAAEYARQAPPTMAGGGQAQASSEELQPLLQIRNWLDAVQGKTQNNAIQQALGSFAQGDPQTVQQVSIPLIWLGPSAWANLEWWQEKERKKDAADEGRGKRLWRFRLFFELTPLAPLCADLIWEPGQTHITFWSEDQNTLGFLNRHLDTLEQWTEGLGERRMQTRHGMPRKKTTPDPDHFKPLVDVRT